MNKQFKVLAVSFPDRNGFSFQFVQVICHPVDLCFDLFALCACLLIRVIQVEIPFFFIRSVQLMPYRHTVCLVFPDAAFPLVFKPPFVFKDQAADKRCHPLDHDHEIIAALVHVSDVLFTEIDVCCCNLLRWCQEYAPIILWKQHVENALCRVSICLDINSRIRGEIM